MSKNTSSSHPERLIPVIAQDSLSGDVLMLAYADAAALKRTRKTGLMHYHSRSRNRLWKKGESSGHVQRVESLHYDCDRDALLARVRQTGPACHRGTYSCFAREPFGDALAELENTLRDRSAKRPRGSYTTQLLDDPRYRRGKILEEAAELVAASRTGRRRDIVAEAADVIYHVMVELAAQGRSMADVRAELRRRKTSGPSGRRPRSGAARSRAGRR